MRWYDQVFMAVIGLLELAVPFMALAGWIWWSKRGRHVPGWRGVVSKIGVLYSSLIVAVIAVCLLGIPHAPAGAEFPYANHWSPIVFRFSLVGVVVAVLGKGWVRATNLLCAFGGCSFALLMIAML
jgi:hypothetical protein